LHAVPQWIVVKLVPLPTGKVDKLPVDPRTMTVSTAHDPAVWLPHAQAVAVAAAMGSNYTTGFVLTPNDPFWCLDIDNCLTPSGWSPLAQSLVARLPGCAIEVSLSGRGLHVWGRGAVPPHSKKRVDLGIELYTELRFIAAGRPGATGSLTTDCPTIAAFAAEFFPAGVAAEPVPDEGPCPEWRGPEDDDELLRRAFASTSARKAFGGGGVASFADLWDARADVLAQAFPADQSSLEPYDASSADAALAQHLAFWTGRDVARIERLMRRSKLVREKWDQRNDYLVARTIRGACSRQRDVLRDAPPLAPPLAVVPSPEPVAGPAAPSVPAPLAAHPTVAGAAPVALASAPQPKLVQGDRFLTASDQMTYFEGCVYVIDQHRVLVPGGDLLTPERFKAVYGGANFVMTPNNGKTTRNAFEALTESQVVEFDKAHGTMFKPRLPYGTIINEGGRKRVNTFWPAYVRRVRGDASPWYRHLEALFPNGDDAHLLMCWLACAVQYLGEKSQWLPLIIGAEGNGKSFLMRALAESIGLRYCHNVRPENIGGQFNAYLRGKLLAYIEDIMRIAAEQWETMKPLITGEYVEIEGKGIDQQTDEICLNWIAASNHINALQATFEDRRTGWFITGQMNEAEVTAHGMREKIRKLWKWAKENDGFAIIAEELHTFALPEGYRLEWFKGTAPRTSTTLRAVQSGMGSVEQAVLEAIEEGVIGFRGGWVSSIMLDAFLSKRGRAHTIPHNRRREMLGRMGYFPHPGLPEGRTHNAVLPDGAKPRLYVPKLHTSVGLTDPRDIAAAYTKAQEAA
jgi:hypothetical protein